jgi:hypothetical protein
VLVRIERIVIAGGGLAGLRAHQNDLALVPTRTEFLHAAEPGQPTARDYYPLDTHEHTG